jgi:hypothetical protein
MEDRRGGGGGLRPRRFLVSGGSGWVKKAHLWECALGENTAGDISTKVPIEAHPPQ